MTSSATDTEGLTPYVSTLLRRWAPSGDDDRHMRMSGTLAFVDISGFTRLTERLATRGKVGAEQMSDMLSATFTGLLTETRDEGADLVKWGGDAMLLLFEGPEHAARAARASYRMRATLTDIGRMETGSVATRLRMSVGVHSGDFDFFLVGDPLIHRELIISGPAASRTAAMEAAASADQIALSSATAALLERHTLGSPLAGGRLLRSAPARRERVPAPRAAQTVEAARVLPPPIRRHLLDGTVEPEHRLITVAFVEFSGTDGLLEAEGPGALTDALDAVVRNVQEACSDHDVTFFESDINSDGGKIMLTAGAPRSAHHDEERMLRVARLVLDRAGALPLRIGINRGHVFAGDFGPSFRRTYSVKGDAINLAARVMAKARPGQLLATVEVVARSPTVFRTGELPPFAVKGKSHLVRAVEVGALVGSRSVDRPTVPVVGREDEVSVLEQSLVAAGSGEGRLVEIVGEAGIGKSRLVAELLRRRPDVRVVTGPCDQYASATAYFPFRQLLREALEAPLDADAEDVARRLGRRVSTTAPHLVPWLPLLGIPLHVAMPSTREVEEVDDQFRKARLEAVVLELLDALLPGPAILVFDDAHLMDDASAALVRRLVLHVRDRPWLILVTRRDQQDGFLPETDDEHTSLRPPPLDPGAALELVHATSRDRPLTPSASAALALRSGGNPLFLEALVMEASRAESLAQLPESVEGLVASQIDRLAPADRIVLRYAAVLGTEVDEAALDGLLEKHDAQVSSGAMTRLADFLVRDEPGGLRFRNALLREVAYEGLPYRRRKTLHDQVGRAIEEALADPEDQCELLSLHFFHAGRHEQAWRFSVLAGERALAKFAHGEAMQFFERAADSALPGLELDPVDVARVFEHLADSRFLVGLSQEAGQAYALARRQLRGDAVRLASIIEKEARIDHRRRKFSQAMRRISGGLRALEGVPGPAAEVARSLLTRRYAYSLFNQGRIEEALRWAEVAGRAAEDAVDTDALAQAYEMLNAIYAGSGRQEPLPYGTLALQAYIELGNLPRQGHCLNNLAVQAFTSGRWDQALTSYRQASDVFRRIGDTAAEVNALFNQAELLACQRRYAEAALLLPSVLRTARAVGDDELVALALREQARTMAAAQDVDGAVEALRVAREGFDELGERSEVLATDLVLAEVLLDAGLLAAAGEALHLFSGVDPSDLSSSAHRLIGRHHRAEGRLHAARVAIQGGLEVARRDANRFEEGLLLHELAAVQRQEGRSGGSALRRAREILDQMGVLIG